MPLDSKKIYDVLYELKGDHEKAKEEFIKCFDFAIYTKIKKQYDTKLFFKYLQDKNHSSWKQLLARVNNIIATESPNYEEEIDAVLNLVSDERKNYSIDTLLKFCKKILLPQAYEVLSKSLNSPSIQTFEDMDRIFQAITGRPYVYFLDRYDYYIEKKYLQHIFDKWKAPKFKITPTVSKGPVRMPTATSATKIIGNERLEKIHRMTQEVQDNVLKNDKDVLAGIYSKMYPGENTNVLFSFWENNMYKHLQDTNKRPRERNALLAATVWVFLRTYKNYKGPITNFVTNIKEQNSAKKNIR